MTPKPLEIDDDVLTELLPVYYRRLFPFGPFYRWLSYGNVDTRHFTNREFSFTLHDDIYIRYQAFSAQHELEEAVKKKMPFKIDIGAVFSLPPNTHRQLSSALVPLERELVFDIDMTDYDEVRTCCQGASVCLKCWKFMSLACKILDTALRADFGFSHILWVFSGRRGIHCWVCDETARTLSAAERSAVAEYLQLVSGGENKSKKVSIPNVDRLHSSIKRAADIIDEQFESIMIEDQGLFDSPESIKKFLAIIHDNALRNRVESIIGRSISSKEKWQTIKATLSSRSDDDFKNRKHLLEEIMIQYTYPRLDINVSTGMNHLLKSPFCIHPKTGKVCVPFNPKAVDKFNPNTVPTIQTLIDEINEYDREVEKQAEGETVVKSRVKDYKKTSMNKCMLVFEEFVRNLEQTWKGQHLKIEKSDEAMEF